MTFTNNPNIYSDIKEVLDKAKAAGGGTYTLTSPSAAIHWRARAYHYRRLLYKMRGETPYDDLIVRIPKGSSVCNIEVNVPTGVFAGNNGQTAVIAPTPLDEWELAANELKREIEDGKI